MSDPERSIEKDAIDESWKSSQLSTILEPTSLNYNRFLVSIAYPKYSPNVFGYIELEPLIKGSGGLNIPLRLSERHPLFHVAEANVEAMNQMNVALGNSMSLSEIIQKTQIDSHDLVAMYQNFGFSVTYNEKGFWPEPLHGFTLNFGGLVTGDISLWMYKFRNPLTDEIPFSARFDPNNPVWRESAQKFSTAINTSLPLIVRPANVRSVLK
ncbi:MAG: hypothetical protein WAV51_01815 [Microgenomates group bacterium]